MRFQGLVLVALAAAALPTQAFAWGQEGHSIVAEIAQRALTPAAAAQVAKLLGPQVSMASVASWADDQKGASTYPNNAVWHYVDIPLADKAYNPATECANGDCVIAAIDKAEVQMSCATDAATRADWLKFLIHFVGDIHQPLHTIAEATGGNDIKVTVGFQGKMKPAPAFDTNLHAVWDSTLITKTVYDWGAMVDMIEGDKAIMATAAADALDLKTLDWALETHALASGAWAVPAAPDTTHNPVLDQTYYTTQIPVVEAQLAVAGLRLAGVLNHFLDAAPACRASL